ncbi:MFS transporter [Streptomyces violascens]|uniref:MFS transporter n=1 Tax=Streptomyces violascens TaxID=67381 RepID=UPI00365A3C10
MTEPEDAGARGQDAAAGRPLSLRRRYAAAATVCSGLFLLGLDLTVLNVAIPDLQRRLGPTMEQVQWIVDGYALVLGGTVLALGALTDRMGRRRAFVMGLTVCGMAGMAGAVATTPEQVIAARAIMGAGAALFMPATLSIVTNLFPEPALRHRAIALWAVVGSAGGLTGPLIGGWLVEHFSWRAGFWLNLPVAVAVIVLALLLVPESRALQAEPMDIMGAALSTIALLTLVWAVIAAPRQGWTSAPVLAGGAAAALLLASFIVREHRAKAPMLPLELLRAGRISATAASLIVMSFALYGALFLMTLYLQGVMAYTPWQAGVRTLPLLAALGGGAIAAVPLLRRGDPMWPITLGLAVITVAFAVLWDTQAGSGYPHLIVFQVATGLGGGLVAAAATEAVMDAVPGHQAGIGSAINDATRQVGSTLGVAVLGSVLSTVCTSRLDDLTAGRNLPPLPPGATTGGFLNPEYLARLPSPDRSHLLTAAKQAFTDGLCTAAIVTGLVTAMATAAGALLLRRPATGTGAAHRQLAQDSWPARET